MGLIAPSKTKWSWTSRLWTAGTRTYYRYDNFDQTVVRGREYNSSLTFIVNPQAPALGSGLVTFYGWYGQQRQ
ncbi:MAG: hypothetical protein U0T81_10510 [Saprospiraceae bacterium]